MLTVDPVERGRWEVGWRGDRWEVEVVDERTRHIRSLAGPGRARSGGGALKAPMPGLVIRVLVEPGQSVEAGQGVVVLEAMKMENELKAPAAGVVRAVRAEVGRAVEKGEVLVELEG
jgi:pyruvate carboxylase subunit B